MPIKVQRTRVLTRVLCTLIGIGKIFLPLLTAHADAVHDVSVCVVITREYTVEVFEVIYGLKSGVLDSDFMSDVHTRVHT